MVSTRKAKYFAWSNDGDSGHQFEALDRVPSSSFCRKPTWEKQRRESVTGKDFFLVIQRPPFCALFTEKGHFLSTVCYWRWKTWRTSEKRPNHGTDLHQFRGHLGRSGSEAETWDHYKIQSRIQGIQVSQYWLHFQVWWQHRIGYTFRKCPCLF